MTKQAQKTQATKQKILDASKLLMRERGFENTSIRDICSEAGVSTGSFYNIFSSKEDLLLSVFYDTRVYFMDSGHDLDIASVARTYMGMYKTLISDIGFDYLCEIFFAGRRGNKLLFNENHPATKYITDALAHLKEAGKIRDDEDPGILENRIKSACIGALYASMCLEDEEILYEIIEKNVYAILKDKAI